MTYSVLLVDNNPKSNTIIEKILKKESCLVISVSNIRSACDSIREQLFDAVVLDGSLIDGKETKFVTNCKLSNSQTIVTVIADDGDLDTVIELLRQGADDYILKPFSEDKLLLNIKRLIKKLDYRSKIEQDNIDFQKKKNLQSLGFLARGIAHDFNNMLAAILGYIEVASSLVDGGNKKEIKELLNGGAHGVNQAKKITSALLTFAEGGTPVKERVELDSFFKTYLLPGYHAKTVAVTFRVKGEIHPIAADPDQMLQLFNSVMDNAFKALGDKGSVHISCCNVRAFEDTSIPVSTGEFAVVRIADTGKGIPGNILPHIFDPYFTTKTIGQKKGVGLGLAICHSIVQRHNGYITAESEPGKGTKISVYLPKSDPGDKQPYELAKSDFIPFQSESDDGIGRSHRILIMDDERLVRDILERSLTEMGYEVATAKEGDMAVDIYSRAILEGRKFDAVILDLTNNLGMGGIETLKQLKKLETDVKALVATGYSDDPIVADYNDHGFSDCLQKPFKYNQLKQALEQLLH